MPAASSSLPRIMPLFAPPFGPPPLSCGPLSLAIVQNHDPVSVLQTVPGAASVLAIATSLVAPPGEPCAAPSAPPVSKRKPLFEPAPVGLRPDRKTMPRSTGSEIRIAHRACHFALRALWGVFGENL